MAQKKRKYLVPPGIVASQLDLKKPIRAGDLRDLVCWLLLGDSNGPPAPSFVRVSNRPALTHVVVLMAPGLKSTDFCQAQNINPQSTKDMDLPWAAFETVYPVQAPRGMHARLCEAAIAEFMRVPMSKAEKGRAERARKDAKRAADGREDSSDKITLSDLALSASELEALAYPKPEDEGFMGLAKLDEGATDATGSDAGRKADRLFAVDCEMCETTGGRALTRVAVVDAEGKLIYHTFVKPRDPITDYLTAWSGITPQLLEGVTTTVEDVQRWFAKHVSSRDFVAGHSLEQDLRQIRIAAPRVIDTAVSFAHYRGLPYRHSLKSLAKRYLNKDIQQGDGSTGHDPEEDARTCVQLIDLKLRRGLDYGSQVHSQPLMLKTAEAGNKVAIVDREPPRWDCSVADVVVANTDSMVVDNTIKMSRSHNLVYATIRDSAVAESVQSLIQGLQDSPEWTALVVWNGAGDVTEQMELLQRRTEWQEAYAAGTHEALAPWTTQNDAALAQANLKARTGVALVAVVGSSDSAEQLPAKKQKV